MLNKTNRINSIDLLRGLVMIIMALDHTRDFFHIDAMTGDPVNPLTTTVPLFFTRWITHYCAPIFVLLSGISAFLSSKNKSPEDASIFLIKRGAWLVFVEISVVTLGLTFNPFFNFIILQVIWAIGMSMILLGIFSRISFRLTLITGILLIAGHNILDYSRPPGNDFGGGLLNIFLVSKGKIFTGIPNHIIGDFYAILPWTGIMFLGYCMGTWFKKDRDTAWRKKWLTVTGCSLIAVFILLRLTRSYGDPLPWQPGYHSFLSFLNTNKYPPSLLYTCMTLGPALLFLAFFEQIQNRLTEIITVYGRVPFFYYILHFYILHAVLVVLFFASGHTAEQIADPNSIFLFRPIKFGYSLPLVYLIWLSVVASLYIPCRWFYRYKSTHSQWWLKYL